MAATICTVSGTCKKIDGTAFQSVTVKASCARPFVHPTDSVLYENYEVTTTTDSSGAWSLSLVETATPALTYTVSFYYPGSLNDYQRKDYTVTIPNSASVAFESLISGQV